MDILLKFDVYGPLDGLLQFLSTPLAHIVTSFIKNMHNCLVLCLMHVILSLDAEAG